MPQGRFRVAVTKQDLVFSAAHFITLPGHRCEALHGHNYRAGVEIEGGLDADVWYVLDFVALKRLMRRLTDELDHRVLLPGENPVLQIRQADGAVTVSVSGEPRYRFPASDCVVLPMPNTTVELLARHFADRVRDELWRAGVRHLSWIELEVEENFGQSAVYRAPLTPPAD
jgi:6-pyruvoyltetrahydropterin/6-carboxytetrahydropterin synthase